MTKKEKKELNLREVCQLILSELQKEPDKEVELEEFDRVAERVVTRLKKSGLIPQNPWWEKEWEREDREEFEEEHGLRLG